VDLAIPETCNGRDDDSDGRIDEGFPVGGPCAVGVGECTTNGAFLCTLAGDRICSALPGTAGDEICNGLDDDCDGAVDEAFVGELGLPCSVGTGRCSTMGTVICGEGGLPTCSATQGEAVDETCNDADDDCDGFTDEAFPDLGAPCTVGQGSCSAAGVAVCSEDGAGTTCDAVPRNPTAEACNGLDDDCDERVDEERSCGEYVRDQCHVWLGWAQFGAGPAAPSVNWGACPDEGASIRANLRCTGSTPDEQLRFLTLADNYELSADDQLAFAFTCDDEMSPLVAQWLETRCAFFIGHAAGEDAPDAVDEWGDCPASLAGPDPLACTSSGRDGLFHTLGFRDVVDEDDHFALAFICTDPAQEDRAANVTDAVQVRFAWAHSDSGEADLVEAGCPSEGPEHACAESGGDGLFHRMSISAAIRARPGEEADRFALSLGAR
jgi:hypothetical protein